MSLRSLTIPDDSAQWGRWLDEQLVSKSLTSTIIELEVIGGNQPIDAEPFNDVMGNSLPSVLAGGLVSAPKNVHQGLLQRPALLLQLQEIVLVEGGEYWTNLIDRSQSDSQSLNTKSDPEKGMLNELATPTKSSWLRPTALLVAAAAMALLAVFLGQPTPDGSTGWGLAKSDLLQTARPENEMLGVLADASHEWFNKTPDSKEQLVVRLNEYLVGCQAVIDADLPQLSDRNRVLAQAACKRCRASIRKQLNELEAGANLEDALKATNKTIDSLEHSLRALII